MKYLSLSFVAAALLVGCPTPGPVTPQPDADAAPQDDAGDPPVTDGGLADAPPAPSADATTLDDCARAEATLVRLGCKDSRGQALAVTKGGKPFADVCRTSAGAGVDVHPACIAVATSCSKALACNL